MLLVSGSRVRAAGDRLYAGWMPWLSCARSALGGTSAKPQPRHRRDGQRANVHSAPDGHSLPDTYTRAKPIPYTHAPAHDDAQPEADAPSDGEPYPDPNVQSHPACGLSRTLRTEGNRGGHGPLGIQLP